MVIFIYILIVFASVMQSASTKLFNRCCEHSLAFNAIKSCTALVLFGIIAAPSFTPHLPTALFGLSYGVCLCLSMYTGYRALCTGPMALTSMLVSFSVVVPLVWGITVGNEQLSVLQYPALALLLSAIVLTNVDRIKGGDRKKERGGYVEWLILVLMTFLCNGICSVIQKQHQIAYPGAYGREFMFFAMLFCSAVFCGVALIRTPRGQLRKMEGKGYGVLSGLTTGICGFLTLVLAGLENASVLFPIISAGTMLGSLLCGRFLFGERLRVNHYIALATGVVAVVLLKL